MSNLIFMGPDNDRRLGTPGALFGTTGVVHAIKKELNIVGILIGSIVFSPIHTFPSGRVEYAIYRVKTKNSVDRLALAGTLRSEKIADSIGKEREYPPTRWEDSFEETVHQRELLGEAKQMLVNPS